jgi:Protein of unknown function (DUF4012)
LTPDNPDEPPTALGDPPDEQPAALPPVTSRPRRLPRGVFWTLSALVLVAGLACVWAVVAGLRARTGLEGVRSDLERVRDNPPARAELARQLKVDAAKAVIAHDQMHQLGPSLVSHIPFLGRSIVAERTIADAADAVLRAAVPAVDATDGLGGGGTGLDLDRLTKLHQVLSLGAADTAGPLKALASLKTGLTPGVVGSSVAQAQTQLGGVSNDLAHAAALTDAVGDLLGSHGPRTLYIGLENNAELRGTGGLISTFAIAHAANGHLTIGKFQDSQGIAKVAAEAVPVPAPPAYTAAYGPYLANTTLWLNATMDPDIPSSASVLSELSESSLGTKPDAVLLLDVAGMAKIVSATGPLHLSDGSVLTGDQLIKALLVDFYGDGSLDQKVQNARHARLAEAASSGFAALASHESDVSVLKALATAASGRHLALWSSSPAVESELDLAGVSGSTDPHGQDLGMVTVNNLGDSPGYGNKLDYYEQRSLDVNVVVGETSADVTETLVMGNHSPSGLGPYVEGPAHPGRMHLLVSLSADTSAKLEQLTQDGVPLSFTTQQMIGSQQVAFPTDLAPGQTTTWKFEYSVPVTNGHYVLRLVPQPLAKPTDLTVEVSAAPGSTLGTVVGGKSGQWTMSHSLSASLRHVDWWHRKVKL